VIVEYELTHKHVDTCTPLCAVFPVVNRCDLWVMYFSYQMLFSHSDNCIKALKAVTYQLNCLPLLLRYADIVIVSSSW